MRFPVLLGVVGLIAACADSTERPYRLPYANGVEVNIRADHTDHLLPPEKMFDLAATQPDQIVVAAAPGWVRFIKDSGDSSALTNNYVWIEHPLDYCQPPGSSPPGAGDVAIPCRSCPQGLGLCNEWTMYVHMRQGSVQDAPPSGAGLEVGDWVGEGQAIGVEGDVGCVMIGPQCGRHLHFAVFAFTADSPLAQPTDNGDYEPYVRYHGRPERVPLFCTVDGLRLVQTGENHFPGACPPLL